MLKKSQAPAALPGFEHINRFWDYKSQSFAAKIMPGEYYVTRHDEIIATVLGSCVSACVWDNANKVGAMNHFMLPLNNGESWSHQQQVDSLATRYGNFAMEHMINDVLKFGGSKKNLQFKVFGGSRVINNLGEIGESNIEFVLDYLKLEGFRLEAQDVGGINPRKVVFFPLSGKVRVKRIKDLHNDTIIRRETDYLQHIEGTEAVDGEIEMFD